MRTRTSAPLFLILGLLFAPLSPRDLAAQGLLSRTTNLSGGWVGVPGVIHTSFNHRFWTIDLPDEQKVANSPSIVVGIPLAEQVTIAATYASNSRVAGKFNEWEALLRWSPARSFGPFGLGVSGGYNLAAGSVDGELSLRTAIPLPDGFPGDSITILGAGRILSDAFASGETGWFGGGGALLDFGNGFALSADFGKASTETGDPRMVWSGGLHYWIPASPHTIAFYATNTQTSTLQGASTGDRTVWGFEFTVPLTLSRFFGWREGRIVAAY